MPSSCTGRCKDTGIRGYSGSLYDLGMKYCSGCEKFFLSKEVRCSCCGRQMRASLSRVRDANG